ncbi:MAG: mechanosensitive ion channel [Sphingomonadales bacterium]|nr:mechanosensitive ion channel [Sphingomonadales bacterium]MBU3993361.1 mechanosensitive ion channel [Alphaproteobacteria bacterium]
MTWQDGLARVVEHLDAIGFNYGNTRISLYHAIIVVLVVVAVIVVGRIANTVSRRIFGRITNLDATQRVLGEKLASIAVWIITVLIGIDMLGISLTALTVFSGAFGLAIGFGLQKTFGNLIAGLILLMDRSIKPGDVIAIDNATGTAVGQVKKIGIRAVSVTTRDKIEYLIPNENLMTSQVENWSYSSREVRVKVPVGVAYGSDIDQVESLLLQAARAVPRVRAQPEPSVWLVGFGDSSVDFEIQIWITDPEEGVGNVRSDVLKRVWHLFKEHGVEIPFPQRDVNFRNALQVVREDLDKS